MKSFPTKLRLIALAAGSLAVSLASVKAAADDKYNTNDLLLFFQNPTGSVGTGSLALYSLGSTWDVFRDAATPGDPTYGTTISLGNIGSLLTSTYGTNWTSLAATSTIFAGAAGQNASTNPASTAVANGDYARTVYVTKPRTGAGSVGSANSALATYNASNTGVASAISGANNVLSGNQSISVSTASTTIDNQNPFSPTPTTPGTAYTGILGGVQGSLSSTTYSFGSISNVVLGLDLYRISPVVGASGSWENTNSIPGISAEQGYFLGTVTITSGGNVDFTAVPEPSTYAGLAIAAAIIAGIVLRRRQKASLNKA